MKTAYGDTAMNRMFVHKRSGRPSIVTDEIVLHDYTTTRNNHRNPLYIGNPREVNKGIDGKLLRVWYY